MDEMSKEVARLGGGDNSGWDVKMCGYYIEYSRRDTNHDKAMTAWAAAARTLVICMFVLAMVGAGFANKGLVVGGIIGSLPTCLLAEFVEVKRWEVKRREWSRVSDPVVVALFRRLPEHLDTDPAELVTTTRRIASSTELEEQLIKLLNSNDFHERACELVYTVAATGNPATLATARQAVGMLYAKLEWQRDEVKKRQQLEREAKEQWRNELAAAQPDYSDAIKKMVQLYTVTP